jgi:hypothetical protein
MSETFDGDPGWDGHNNRVKTKPNPVIQDFGFSKTNRAGGKGGQNVRLAAKLSGWKIDIVKDDTPVESLDGADKKEEEVAVEETPAVEITPVAEPAIEAPAEEKQEDKKE